MRWKMILIGPAVLLLAMLACDIAADAQSWLADDALTQQAQMEEESQDGEGPVGEPTATPTPGLFPETLEDSVDDFLVECDGEPSPGAAADWADIVEVTRVSENVFEVTFRGELQPVTERIKEGDGEDLPESVGVSLDVVTPEDQYIHFSIDWELYSDPGEREQVEESASDAEYKTFYSPAFSFVDPMTMRIELEPETRDTLDPDAEYQVIVSVDWPRSADVSYACDYAPERN